MNENEPALRLKAGRVVHAIRKFHGYGQMELAKEFQVSQSNVSKIESGILAPDLRLWMELTRAFKVKDPYCFYYGTAEIETIPQLNKIGKTFYKGTGFKIPRKYLSDALITSRKIRPLIDMRESNLEKQWNEFLDDTKIPREIFDILNFPIPSLIVKDFADFIQRYSSKIDFAKDLDFASQVNHGLMFEDYSRLSTPLNVLKHFVHKQKEYGLDLEYSISEDKGNESSVSVEISPQLLNIFPKKELANNRFFNYSAQYPLLLMKIKSPTENAPAFKKLKMQESNDSHWKMTYA